LNLRRASVLVWALLSVSVALVLLGVCVGSTGWENLLAPLLKPAQDADAHAMAQQIVWDIRLPRTLGAWAAGALLGLAGAVAQGLFRNPLADPYLLGSASGASLGVALALAAMGGAGGMLGGGTMMQGAGWTTGGECVFQQRAGAPGAHRRGIWWRGAGGVAHAGAVTRGAAHAAPAAGRGGGGCGAGGHDASGAAVVARLAAGHAGLYAGLHRLCRLDGLRADGGGVGRVCCGGGLLGRVLDGLSLGEATAHSLGLPLADARGAGGGAGAGHRHGGGANRFDCVCGAGRTASGALGGAVHPWPFDLDVQPDGRRLADGADTLARWLIAPQELPVGVLTAVLGGGYLLWLMHRGGVTRQRGRPGMTNHPNPMALYL
jgi:iron complex transport system permease protein